MKSIILFQLFATASAFADAPSALGLRQGASPFIPLIIIFGIFYFLLIRPQQKKAKVHQQFIVDLKKGDMVITNSGIIGTIKNLSDKFVFIEVDEGVCVKMLKNQVSENANNLKEDNKPKTT